jgi:hypothetical protein
MRDRRTLLEVHHVEVDREILASEARKERLIRARCPIIGELF